MTKHTAIPWYVEYPDTDSPSVDNPSGMPLIVGGQKGTEPVCEILGPLGDEDGPHRGHYDLALLLAAPDLLAALEACRPKIAAAAEVQKWLPRRLRTLSDLLVQIDATIARAKGNTNG